MRGDRAVVQGNGRRIGWDGVSSSSPCTTAPRACARRSNRSSQADGRPMEIIVVDDLSQDDSSAVLRQFAGAWPLRIVAGHGQGAAAAITPACVRRGFDHLQVDQDVVLRPGWMQRLLDEMDDPAVGAVQGCYISDPDSPLCARAMGLDLEQRYAAIRGARPPTSARATPRIVSSASHGRPAGRDLRLRLRQRSQLPASCRWSPVNLRREAQSCAPVARGIESGIWASNTGWLRPHRAGGQASGPFRRRFRVAGGHDVAPRADGDRGVLAAAIAVFAAASGGVVSVRGRSGSARRGARARTVAAGISAARRFGTLTPLVFLCASRPRSGMGRGDRDVAGPPRMRPSIESGAQQRPRANVEPLMSRRGACRKPFPPERCGRRRILGLIPAHNEAPAGHGRAELRASWRTSTFCGGRRSTDRTAPLLEQLDVRWLQFPERLGIGSAMRAGFVMRAPGLRRGGPTGRRRPAPGRRHERLLGPIDQDWRTSCWVRGSRTPSRAHGNRPGLRNGCSGPAFGAERQCVTDPTSGFCVLDLALSAAGRNITRRVTRTELRLFLSRNA